MACATVVFARRFARSRCCSCLPRAFLGDAAAVASAASWGRISAWASSLARWAMARAWVTPDERELVRRVFSPVAGVRFGSLDVIVWCRLWASLGPEGNQAEIWFEAGCRVLAKAGGHYSLEGRMSR